jgi:hypothetical protein
LSFPSRGVKVEEMIKWVAKEVKTVPDTVWQLNNNFIILDVEGVLNMLNNEGCQQLGRLRKLPHPATLPFCNMSPRTCKSWRGNSCENGGNHTACLRLFAILRRLTP